MRLFGDSNLVIMLRNMSEKIRMNLELHEEHMALVDAVDIIDGMEEKIEQLEEEMYNDYRSELEGLEDENRNLEDLVSELEEEIKEKDRIINNI